MSHARFDQNTRQTLTACVKEIETRTDAELVLVIRARSASYRHADYLFGALLSFAGLGFLLFSPFTFHPTWVLIEVVLLFALGAFVSSRCNRIRRLFTNRKLRDDMVRTSAAAMFYEAGIANTRAETGILIYLSLFERRLELLADRGILKAVPAMEWNEELFELHEAGRKGDAKLLENALHSLSVLLAKYLPASGENPNELTDAPRIDLK
jgi:putative membrane protein